MKNEEINEVIDLTGEVCPMVFMKTKLKLADMNEGEHLEVIINKEGITDNVPTSLREEGHKIIKVKKINDKFSILIEKRK